MMCANVWTRWMWTPLGVIGIAAIASFLCGIVLHPQAFLFTSALVMAAAIGTIWPWIGVRGLGGSLTFESERAREGETVAARLVLRNRLPWSCWGVSIRGGPSRFPGLARVPRLREIERRVTFDVDRRGVYPSAPIVASSGFPFGCWEPGTAMVVTRPMIVWPKTYPLGAIPSSAGDRAYEGSVTIDRPGVSGDVSGVRAYRRGDSPRSIHWPQTARHGCLIVCERQAESIPWVQIVLDADPLSHEGDRSREWAIRIAGSFLERWIDCGAVLEAILGDAVLPPRAGGDAKRRALDALARLPDGGPSLESTLDTIEARRFAGGLRIVITTDRGLSRLPSRMRRDPCSRFVVLLANGFADDPKSWHPPCPMPAWITIAGPGEVASRLRSLTREVAHAS